MSWGDVASLSEGSGTTEDALAVSSPVKFYGIFLYNKAASVRFIKLYDQATAPASTDTPKMVFRVGASSQFELQLRVPVEFNSGFGYRITTGAADSDTGAPAAGDIVGLLLQYATE